MGVTASLLTALGKGPLYLDSVGTPDPTLTAITSDGDALFGGVEPGRMEITVSDATCSPAVLALQARVATKPNTIAIADTMTQMTVIRR